MASTVHLVQLTSIALILALACLGNAKRCVTDRNQEVDWYVALRIPGGKDYLIYEANSRAFRPTTEVLLENALADLSFTEDSVVLWNDQTSEGDAPRTKAHSKGLLHFSSKRGGFIMLHSIPHFVDISSKLFNSVTRETSHYGQSIVCVSLNKQDQVNTIIDHLMAQASYIYLNTFDGTKRPLAKVDKMASKLSFGFEYVTKTSMSEEHPFEGLLRNHYKSGWLVNTWGRPYKASSCKEKLSISNIVLKNFNGLMKKNTQDHSKWALSHGDNRRIVCIGDLNHMDSQSTRGGSFMCKDDAALYSAMVQLVVKDECNFAGHDFVAAA